MNRHSLFDIISPIMIGPSSSHTAGAVRIGLLARKIFGDNVPTKVKFTLYNSFAKTGKGHGTDKGLLGGVMGFAVDDPRIKDAFEIAKQNKITYEFSYAEDFNRHPNSVDIEFSDGLPLKISGDSLGGGAMRIHHINGYQADLKGDFHTLLMIYTDKPGMIQKVTKIIQDENINVASMSCDRESKGKNASMTLYLDSPLTDRVLEELGKIKDVFMIRNIGIIK